MGARRPPCATFWNALLNVPRFHESKRIPSLSRRDDAHLGHMLALPGVII
jgi:hypothetical protein